jgi:hypothetical protein
VVSGSCARAADQPSPASRWHAAHTVLTGLLDRPALYGVLAGIKALGLDLL